jgi:sugar lactone lactonase YvrE
MKLYQMTTVLALSACILACKEARKEEQQTEQATAKEEKPPVKLTLKWETEPQLTTCESVLYDDKEDVLYVSNINGAPDGKDGNGFISKVSLDGKVLMQQWAKGMDAPKGMGLRDGKLYVADIDKVHEIDTKSGKTTKTYPVKGSTFLNDIAVDNDKVYISDSGGGSIYLLEDGKVSTFMSDLQGPNGLFTENNEIVMALWGAKTLNTVDPSSKEVTQRATDIENPDGIESIGNNEYLVSSWNGMVTYVDSDWKKTMVLDTRSDSVNSADIEYIKSKNLLLVPTFFKNTVRAYEVEK